MSTDPPITFQLDGEIGRRLRAVTEQWILPAPHANPGILEMFRYRDRQPYPGQSPWVGEFAGKYLTHAVLVWRLTQDPRLHEQIRWFAAEVAGLQDADGYLGAWPKPWRLRRGAPNCQEPWDAWGHYHIMLGMLLWHESSGDPASLACVRRIGDLLCDRFLGDTPERLHDAGAQEMNQAPVHALALLHRVTGERRYLDLALQIVADFAIPPAGDFLRAGLADTPFHLTSKPRWESLHPIQGLAELFRITGDPQYRTAFGNLWRSMRQGDRHNNGGFSSGEKAVGNPYDEGVIESCCTIAWSAMSVDMLELSEDAQIADELELSLYNSGLGMMSPTGRWATYNTPMSGEKLASTHSVVFQARAGTPELNCCSVNAPRILGMIATWALLPHRDGLAVNYYGPGRIAARTPRGRPFAIQQTTEYPREGRIVIAIDAEMAEEFPLFLRIPAWSARTRLRLNGHDQPEPAAGGYATLLQSWRTGDRIELDLDFSPHVWCKPRHRCKPTLSAWDTAWTLFGPVTRGPADAGKDQLPELNIVPAFADDAAIPDRLHVNGTAYPPIAATSKAGILDGRELFGLKSGEQPSLVGCTAVTVEHAQEVQLAFEADWWISWYVNGVRVFVGSGAGTCTLPLRLGRNLIAFTLSGGTSRPCLLSLARTRLDCEAPPDPALREVSLYRGPILLAFDPTYHTSDRTTPPTLASEHLHLQPATWPTWLKPWMLFRCPTADGGEVHLCDFASAGRAGGHPYTSWLPMRVAPDASPLRPSPFTPD